MLLPIGWSDGDYILGGAREAVTNTQGTGARRSRLDDLEEGVEHMIVEDIGINADDMRPLPGPICKGEFDDLAVVRHQLSRIHGFTKSRGCLTDRA